MWIFVRVGWSVQGGRKKTVRKKSGRGEDKKDLGNLAIDSSHLLFKLAGPATDKFLGRLGGPKQPFRNEGHEKTTYSTGEGAIEKRMRAQMERKFDHKFAVVEKRLQDEQQVPTVSLTRTNARTAQNANVI